MLSVFHPMGFPVEIESNSIDIFRAAQDIWGKYPDLAEQKSFACDFTFRR